MIDWYLTLTLAVFQLYLGEVHLEFQNIKYMYKYLDLFKYLDLTIIISYIRKPKQIQV